MDTREETKALVKHAQQLIEQSESDAIQQHGSIVVMAEEILKSSNLHGKYIDEFMNETSIIHKSQDTLLLVCLGIIAKIGFDGDKQSTAPQLNDTNYGFILSEYLPLKKAVNSKRAAELFSDEDETPEQVEKTSSEDMFRDYISLSVGRLYKPGVLWKQKLMWQLVKEWNNRRATTGIPGSVRKELGEEKALELFREIANEIMADKDLLDKAMRDYREFNPYAK